MVDQYVLTEKLKILAEYLQDLENEKDTSFQDFCSNKRIRRYIERTLHLAAECCLDIGSHIISSERLREPLDNKDIFVVLAENAIIPREELPDLTKMAQFRNILVHNYARLDAAIIFGVLKNNLDTFRRFARAIQEKYRL
ncbi:MAG: DUF86 domain-containing protein [Thermoanaerobacteraceae bacterium]|nr:DUF86 domain-containing protein [Thermoanaerobacteraceae bacterium]